MNMAEALARNAQRFPDKLAVVDERRQLTHRDFHLRSNRLGNYLLRQGIKKGDRVALSCGNRAEHLEFIFALAKIGAVSVPFDYGWSVREYHAMINFFEPSAFLIEERHETRNAWSLVQDRLDEKRILAIGAASATKATPYEEAIAQSASDEPTVDIDGKDPFIIMITSGTTGFPKGCVIDHETYALRSLNNAISKGLNDRERGLLTLPLHFNAGRGSAMSLLYLGGTLFLLDKFDDDTFVDILEREQITYTILVPALCQRLLRHPKLATIDKSSLSYVGITGGHLTPALAQAITEKLSPHVYEAYASTDCGQIAILKPEDRATHSDSVGQTIWAVLIKILDDDCQEVRAGELGEICLRSPMAIQGYYRNSEATEEFFRGGWCHTGDIGFLDSAGYMHVTGRKKNMIKSGGISIYPEEIEEVLSACPGVADVAVMSWRHSEWGESVKALVVPKSGTVLEPQHVIDFCKNHLASYKAPKSVEVVAGLPRTALGKIDRGKLAASNRQSAER
ncbi:MAG: class I adenylate-forming enzyme family protein [Candidatus Binatia bacterium]